MRTRLVLVLLFILLPLLFVTLPSASRAATNEIVVESVRITRGAREIPARLYRLESERLRAGLVLLPGIVPGGIEDERLIRFARFLAREGFVVMTPEVAGSSELRLDPEAVGDVIAAFDALAARKSLVDSKRIGVWGICIGGGYALAAAESPELRERAAFVVAHDTYFDLRSLIQFLFTGEYQFGDVKGRETPNRYARAVALKNYLSVIYSGTDRDRILAADELLLQGKDSEAVSLAASLSDEGKKMLKMILSDTPPDAAGWARKIIAEKESEIASISPSTSPQSLRCPVYLLHSKTGAFVPYTETLALAAALDRNRTPHSVLLTDVLDHVTFNESGISVPGGSQALARELMELTLFLNRILKSAK